MAIDNRTTKEAAEDLASVCYHLDALRRQGDKFSGLELQQLDSIIHRLTDLLREIHILRGKANEALVTFQWEK